MRSALLAVTLVLGGCATTPGPNLEDCLRGDSKLSALHAEGTWADPMDSLITSAIDSRRESFYCPTPRHAIGGL